MAERHPLGFSKWTLVRTPWFRVRLHVWRPDAVPSRDRHTHRHWLLSVPLWGRFLDTRYRRLVGGGSGLRAFAVPSPCVDESRWEPLTYASGLREVAEHVRFPLVPYFCSRSAIHHVQPLTKWAASLVLTGRSVGEYTTVWRPAKEGT